MIEIDGSLGEGGGQVLRTSLALSALTGEGIHLKRIRAGRPNPGLRPQHLTAVRAAAAICSAHVDGAELESQRLTFVPGGAARAGRYAFDVAQVAGQGSAGSVGLVLQAVLLPLAAAGGTSHLILRGGTHVPWAPSVDYLQSVFLPTVARMGVTAEVTLDEWGFYPVGKGQARARIEGRPGPSVRPLDLSERGGVARVWGRAVAANLPSHIAQRMANRARNVLAAAGLNADLQALRVRGAGPGAGIFLSVAYEHVLAGFTAYGKKGLPSERVAEAACEGLLAHHRSGAAADPHLADQLVLPMALAEGRSGMTVSSVTDHLMTNLEVIQTFLPVEVLVEGPVGGPGRVTIIGSKDD
jgi:RNA 3'-terminal phosphate cyclase (ATP)